MIFSTLTNKEYIEENNPICPVCESNDISWHDGPDVDGDTITQTVYCETCGAKWTDFYRLSAYRIEDTPNLDSQDVEIVKTTKLTGVSIVKTDDDAWSVLVKKNNRAMWFTNKRNIRIKKIKDTKVKRDVLQSLKDIALMEKLSRRKED